MKKRIVHVADFDGNAELALINSISADIFDDVHKHVFNLMKEFSSTHNMSNQKQRQVRLLIHSAFGLATDLAFDQVYFASKDAGKWKKSY